jgi:hypothetical protein
MLENSGFLYEKNALYDGLSTPVLQRQPVNRTFKHKKTQIILLENSG